jgi:NAD-dependent SIR2 family protein deacetylase
MDMISQAAQVIADADAVLIGAGAGMSAAAGLDYADEATFAERYPGMLQYGARNQYQLMGYPFSDEALKWGYLAVGLDHVFHAGQTQVYQDLLGVVGDRDYFVMTSNVDRYFHKNGFADDRIYTPQGDYEALQCINRCHDGTWDAKPAVAAMLPHINRSTQLVEDRRTLPVCPRCGGPVFMNVRGGDWFIDQPYQLQAEALTNWLSEVEGKKLAVIEVGAGFNTPGVIRVPLQTVGSRFENASFIRINRDHAEGPEGTISISENADIAMRKINRKFDTLYRNFDTISDKAGAIL